MSVRLTAASSQDLHNSANVFNQNADYTWSAWIYFPTTVGGSVLRVGNSAGTADTDAVQIQGATLRVIAYDHSGTAIDLNDGATTLAAGKWYYITLRRSGSALGVYLDGVAEISITAATTGRSAANYMSIGSRRTADLFADCRVSYSRITASALTPAQLLTERLSVAAIVSAASNEPLVTSGALGIWTAAGSVTTEANLTQPLFERIVPYSYSFGQSASPMTMTGQVDASGGVLIIGYMFRNNGGVTLSAPTRDTVTATILSDAGASGAGDDIGHELRVYGIDNPSVGTHAISTSMAVSDNLICGFYAVITGTGGLASAIASAVKQFRSTGSFTNPSLAPASAAGDLTITVLGLNGYDEFFADASAATVAPAAGQSNAFVDVEAANGGATPAINDARIILTAKTGAASSTTVGYTLGVDSSTGHGQYEHVAFTIPAQAAAIVAHWLFPWP